MTFRRHPITGEPIIFAPGRAQRPYEGEADCPFCPGNESQTPPEVLRIGDASSWRVRVFPNKFPAVEHHEVIVETPGHDDAFDAIANASDVVAVYAARYRALSASDGVAYVALFKNQGKIAGASLMHPHSQIAALPFTPPRVAFEGASFARASKCPLCGDIDAHVIDETATMSWIAPRGSTFAHQQWIVPKRHQREMATLSDEEIADLAALLQRSAAGMRAISDSYNWLFLNFPREAAAHAYVDVFPRVTNVAGFELETGTFIDVVDPADTARRLRGNR